MCSNARSPSGEGRDGAVSLAGVIAVQRAEHGIPHAVSCRALGVSQGSARSAAFPLIVLHPPVLKGFDSQ